MLAFKGLFFVILIGKNQTTRNFYEVSENVKYFGSWLCTKLICAKQIFVKLIFI